MPTRKSRGDEVILQVFAEKKPQLIQLATRILGCSFLAEDVLQDVLLKIIEARIDPSIDAPVAYLFRMVRNTSIDQLRRRARERCETVPDDDVEQPDCAFPCPETILQGSEALKIVLNALGELPERTRWVFEKHRIDGVSQRDLAIQMGVSPTLVNFMVRDAHNHCRLRLLLADPDRATSIEPAGRQALQAAARQAEAAKQAIAAAPKQVASNQIAPKQVAPEQVAPTRIASAPPLPKAVPEPCTGRAAVEPIGRSGQLAVYRGDRTDGVRPAATPARTPAVSPARRRSVGADRRTARA